MTDFRKSENAPLEALFDEACFDENLDTMTQDLIARDEVPLAEHFNRTSLSGNGSLDGSYNISLFVARFILRQRDFPSEFLKLGYNLLLTILMNNRDPRRMVVRSVFQKLKGYLTSEENDALSYSAQDLADIEKKLRVIERSRTSYFPCARLQVNSRAYIKAMLGVGEGMCPPLPDDSRFMVLGTCFADNMQKAFRAHGLDSLKVSHMEEMPVEVLFAEHLMSEGTQRFLEENANPCFILTLGFAEFKMMHKEDIQRSNENFSAFRSPEYISECVLRGTAQLREKNPNARLFLTVSPVPLEATNSGFNVFEANTISKSIIRLAAAMACAEDERITYFPSYEIVTQVAPSAGICPFGEDDGHPRHVNQAVVNMICALFIETYCPWLLEG